MSIRRAPSEVSVSLHNTEDVVIALGGPLTTHPEKWAEPIGHVVN